MNTAPNWATFHRLYNFARPHKTLTNPYPKTPAMVAGISNHVWTIEEIVKLSIIDNLTT